MVSQKVRLSPSPNVFAQNNLVDINSSMGQLSHINPQPDESFENSYYQSQMDLPQAYIKNPQNVIIKKGQQDIVFEKAAGYDESKRTDPAESIIKNNKLVNVIYNEGEYFVTEPKNSESSRHNIIDNHLWLIAKFMPNRTIEIKEGDVVRFGRIPFKVAKLQVEPGVDNSMNRSVSADEIMGSNVNLANSNNRNHEQSSEILPNSSQLNISGVNDVTTLHIEPDDQVFQGLSGIRQINDSDGLPAISFLQGAARANNDGLKGGLKDNSRQAGIESGKACRICLDDSDDIENPFITPCKCAGSMKFIHLNCLREWLDSKRVAQKLEGVYSYYWEELVCELCKEPLALNNISVSNNNKSFYLLNFKQPKNKKYMVLESDIECLSKAIHVIVFSQKTEFNVGRRINNDITVSDISVSRKQSSIKFVDGKFYVEDCDSKFGTFVKVQGPRKVKHGERLPLQIEKKCFFIRHQPRFSFVEQCFLSCGMMQVQEQYDHYIDVKEKFPKEYEQVFLPKQPVVVVRKKMATNRVGDETLMTQMSNGNISQLAPNNNSAMQIAKAKQNNNNNSTFQSNQVAILNKDMSQESMTIQSRGEFLSGQQSNTQFKSPFEQLTNQIGTKNVNTDRETLPPIIQGNKQQMSKHVRGMGSQNIEQSAYRQPFNEMMINKQPSGYHESSQQQIPQFNNSSAQSHIEGSQNNSMLQSAIDLTNLRSNRGEVPDNSFLRDQKNKIKTLNEDSAEEDEDHAAFDRSPHLLRTFGNNESQNFSKQIPVNGKKEEEKKLQNNTANKNNRSEGEYGEEVEDDDEDDDDEDENDEEYDEGEESKSEQFNKVVVLNKGQLASYDDTDFLKQKKESNREVQENLFKALKNDKFQQRGSSIENNSNNQHQSSHEGYHSQISNSLSNKQTSKRYNQQKAKQKSMNDPTKLSIDSDKIQL